MAEGIATADEALRRPDLAEALVALLYQLADDELILGHRDSEWLGMAPEIEEDVAFSSISQDEVGHAVYFYGLLADLGEGARDALAFERPTDVRRNAILVERDNGDFAFTIARHYLYDTFDRVRLEALQDAAYAPLRHGVQKILREEYYHGVHVGTWFSRLAIAGGEAKERLQRAIDIQWGDVDDLFRLGDAEDVLVSHGILQHRMAVLQSRWLTEVTATMRSAGLRVPAEEALPGEPGSGPEPGGRLNHTSELTQLLATLTEVYDLDKSAIW